jgi:methionyl-tRNA formyltransferase
MTALNLVFGGTPEFAVPALTALLAAGHRIAAVYTQPDRPAGRGQKLQMSAVKKCALKHGLRIEQPTTLREPSAALHLAGFHADAMIVVAYGLILPQAILDVPRLGCINIHGSLLPRWRGAAPIQRALLAGDVQTGVTIMRMDAGLDTGPMLSSRALSINDRETSSTLHDRLSSLGAQALCETLPSYASGTLQANPQPGDGVTYAHKIRKEEAVIDWRGAAPAIDRQVRAYNQWPVAETLWRGQQLRIWEALPAKAPTHEHPGTVIEATKQGIVVATGDGVLAITRLQLAGRKALSAADFMHSQRIVGDRLGST